MQRTFRENKDGTTTVIEINGDDEVEILVDKNWKVLHIYRVPIYRTSLPVPDLGNI